MSRSVRPVGTLVSVYWLVLCTASFAAEPVPIENVPEPAPNRVSEPVAKEFSLDRAAGFLDSASLHWQAKRKCMTCHTNFAYLYARPGIPLVSPAQDVVRRYAEDLVQVRWPASGPRWDAEVVAAAAALAFNDSATTKELHPATHTALDRMWTVQKEDGSWDWLKCGWPPMESDDHYGVALAAIAVGVAPADYAETEQAKAGMSKIRKYFAENTPPTLHHKAMRVWAASYTAGLISDEERDSCVQNLLKLQKEDGGWALATFGDWERSDGAEQDLTTSDGYGTGFALYALRRAKVPADSKDIRRGVVWLKTHQRESGRWFTRSLNKDNKHFISHAGSAMAVMALHECKQ